MPDASAPSSLDQQHSEVLHVGTAQGRQPAGRHVSRPPANWIERLNKRRIAPWAVAALAGVGYLLVRYLRAAAHFVDDTILLPAVRLSSRALDVVGPIWGAFLAMLILAGGVWFVREARRRLRLRHPRSPRETRFEAAHFTPDRRLAHVQLALQAILIGVVFPVALRLSGLEDDLLALSIAGVVLCLGALLFLEVRLWWRGGVQTIHVSEEGIVVSSRRTQEKVRWHELKEVDDPLEKDGIILHADDRDSRLAIYPAGYRADEFERMASLIAAGSASIVGHGT